MGTVSAIRALFTPAALSPTDEQVRQENLAVAEGLKRQDPGLLDQLQRDIDDLKRRFFGGP